MSRIETRMITPKDAGKLLAKNFEKNRKVRMPVVMRYVLDMKEGRWNTDACPPIVISSSGKLLDGQHRLMAIKESGKAVKMDVKTGVDESAYVYFDCGAIRTVTDITDVPDRNNIAALARIAIAVSEGSSSLKKAVAGEIERVAKSGRVSASNAKVIEYINDHLDELLDCTHKASAMYKAVGCGMKSSYSFFVWFLRWLGFDDEVELFLDQFKEPLPFSKTIAVCKQTIARKYAQRGASPTRAWMVEQLLYAFDTFMQGKEVAYFKQTERVTAKYEELMNEKRGKDNGNA